MKIGNIDIHRGILLAPMEDVTDLPFRVICVVCWPNYAGTA
jgi:tRNA-dihydrouridine synthase